MPLTREQVDVMTKRRDMIHDIHTHKEFSTIVVASEEFSIGYFLGKLRIKELREILLGQEYVRNHEDQSNLDLFITKPEQGGRKLSNDWSKEQKIKFIREPESNFRTSREEAWLQKVNQRNLRNLALKYGILVPSVKKFNTHRYFCEKLRLPKLKYNHRHVVVIFAHFLGFTRDCSTKNKRNVQRCFDALGRVTCRTINNRRK